MSIGLPNLEIAFLAAAQETANRSKRGVVVVVVRDAKAQGLHDLFRATEIPVELGEANRRYVERAFTGTSRGGPSKVLLLVLAPAAEPLEGAEDTSLVDGLAALTGYSADYLALPPEVSEAECAAAAEWVKARRAGYDPIKAVLPHTAADDMGVVNFTTDGIRVGANTYTAADYCSRIAGVLAGMPSEWAATYAALAEITALPAQTREEQNAAIGRGELILLHDGKKAKIARAVNSLVTLPEGGKEDWKKVKIVETMDLMTYFARTTVEDEYMGCSNTYANKCLLLVAFGTYYLELEAQGLLVEKSSWASIDLEEQTKWLKASGVETQGMTDQQLREADTGSWVFLALGGHITDAQEDFVLRNFV